MFSAAQGGGGRGGRGKCGRTAGTGAKAAAVGTEVMEAVAEAGRADTAVAASFGRVFGAFPEMVLFHMIGSRRH